MLYNTNLYTELDKELAKDTIPPQHLDNKNKPM